MNDTNQEIISVRDLQGRTKDVRLPYFEVTDRLCLVKEFAKPTYYRGEKVVLTIFGAMGNLTVLVNQQAIPVEAKMDIHLDITRLLKDVNVLTLNFTGPGTERIGILKTVRVSVEKQQEITIKKIKTDFDNADGVVFVLTPKECKKSSVELRGDDGRILVTGDTDTLLRYPHPKRYQGIHGATCYTLTIRSEDAAPIEKTIAFYQTQILKKSFYLNHQPYPLHGNLYSEACTLDQSIRQAQIDKFLAWDATLISVINTYLDDDYLTLMDHSGLFINAIVSSDRERQDLLERMSTHPSLLFITVTNGGHLWPTQSKDGSIRFETLVNLTVKELKRFRLRHPFEAFGYLSTKNREIEENEKLMAYFASHPPVYLSLLTPQEMVTSEDRPSIISHLLRTYLRPDETRLHVVHYVLDELKLTMKIYGMADEIRAYRNDIYLESRSCRHILNWTITAKHGDTIRLEAGTIRKSWMI